MIRIFLTLFTFILIGVFIWRIDVGQTEKSKFVIEAAKFQEHHSQARFGNCQDVSITNAIPFICAPTVHILYYHADVTIDTKGTHISFFN